MLPGRTLSALALAGALLLAGAAHPARSARAESTTGFVLTSSAFKAGGPIPRKYTCAGESVSPPLAWSGAPRGTKSFALIIDDPDAPDPAAPRRTWVHWVLYDIPPSATRLVDGAAKSGLPKGTRVGSNDSGRTGYDPPCPPIGRHRYFHKLYALDRPLGDLVAPDKGALEAAMKGHVLGKAERVGTFAKGK
jgi:Raf kinase inhibitor-like YbhB/YbcL family protein